MKWSAFIFALILCLSGVTRCKAQEQMAVLPDTPKPQPGIIVGTVVDVNGRHCSGRDVTLQGPSSRVLAAVVSSDNGFFEFNDLARKPITSVQRGRTCKLDFTRRHAQARPIRNPVGRQAPSRDGGDQGDCRLFRRGDRHRADRIEEQQRIFGFIPNFYVSYDQNPRRSPRS